MKSLVVVAIFLLVSTSLFAQRGAVSAPSAPRPAAAAAPRAAAPTTGATPRGVGTVLYPAGAVPPVTSGTPFVNTSIPGRVGLGRDRFRTNRSNGTVYAYPVFVGGGYYGNGYYDNGYTGQPAPGGDQPNVVVVYPPQQPPVVINQFGPGDQPRVQPQNLVYPPAGDQASQEPAPETTHYLIAFKDHSIYSAVAYWVDGDTLHYFTTPTTHNQASVALVDRELTERLNKDSGNEVKLPPVK